MEVACKNVGGVATICPTIDLKLSCHGESQLETSVNLYPNHPLSRIRLSIVRAGKW